MDMNQNLGNLMKEAQKMQQRMQEAQQELSQLVVTGEAGGGLVTMKMNGRHDVTEVRIKPSVFEEDVEMLEDLVAAATNDAVRKIEKASKEKISQLTAWFKYTNRFIRCQKRNSLNNGYAKSLNRGTPLPAGCWAEWTTTHGISLAPTSKTARLTPRLLFGSSDDAN